MAGSAPLRPELGTAAVYGRLARNSAWLGGGAVVAALFMMLAVVLSARALSPREFGLLVLFQSATLMVATLMSFSTQQPVIKLGASAQAQGDLDHLGRIIGLGLLIDTGAAMVAALGAFAFLTLGRGWIGIADDELGVAALFAASLLFSGYLTSNGIFRLLNRFALLSMIQAGCAAAILAATAYFYVRHAPFQAYCSAWAAFFVLNSQMPLFVGIYLARQAGVRITFAPATMPRGETRTFLAYCWTTWGVATVEALRSNGDSLLVGATVSVESAGVYSVAKQLAGVLRKLNSVYASAAFPEISALSAHGEHQAAGRVRRRMSAVGALVGGLAIVGALVVGRLVLGVLFGARFEVAYVPLVILTAAAAAQLITQTQTMYVQVYAGPEKLFRAYMFAIAIFLAAALPLTLSLSIAGTAIAQLLFTLALTTFCHLALRSAAHAA
jgi:O-antigen/teichoic acid export membrane protein